jgi:hypothetical protein
MDSCVLCNWWDVCAVSVSTCIPVAEIAPHEPLSLRICGYMQGYCKVVLDSEAKVASLRM